MTLPRWGAKSTTTSNHPSTPFARYTSSVNIVTSGDYTTKLIVTDSTVVVVVSKILIDVHL